MTLQQIDDLIAETAARLKTLKKIRRSKVKEQGLLEQLELGDERKAAR